MTSVKYEIQIILPDVKLSFDDKDEADAAMAILMKCAGKGKIKNLPLSVEEYSWLCSQDLNGGTILGVESYQKVTYEVLWAGG